jgi:hypothetical protein
VEETIPESTAGVEYERSSSAKAIGFLMSESFGPVMRLHEGKPTIDACRRL